MRVAVAGGTGVVGRLVVGELAAAGHEPVVLARSHGVDLLTGEGLDAALDGVEAVIDVSNRKAVSRGRAVAFFGSVSRNLLDAGARAGVHHHVALSIVGIDRVGHGYYQASSARRRSSGAGGCRGPCCGPRSSTSSCPRPSSRCRDRSRWCPG
ncbi:MULTISPECIES: SDR family oxidoreductase [unclassified Streptomyces]|uniref:SDR family oxidoreductase n=1 Tax=unclassified Streptomyces TaxID=2593676 RepID=UPI0029B9AC14|nr:MULTISPECIES: hypothetical protein [unclassified Streptomyces]MDX3428301.1 hypothetical protein [Streptomyces sp. ME01-18a]